MIKRILMFGWFMLLVCVAVSPALAQTLETQSTPLTASTCSGQFVARPLDHLTTVNADPIRMFNSNGSGLAIGDLNNDGLLDVVLANLDQPESILWNEGQLQFRHQELDIPGVTRSVIILDFDADGWRDILFTTQRAAPSWWRNENGSGTFTLTPLNGVANAAYAMNWGDLDADGDLDLVTGSYDAELSQLMTNDFLFNGGAGVYYYDNQDGNFVATRLAETAQALAVYFTDLNGDGQRDIAVGNDFAEFDRYWVRDAGTWVESTPFSVFTHSTMSFDSGDLNNDGTSELFATDMHPYSEDEATMSAWEPVMQTMMAMPMMENDPQVMINTLQSLQPGGYQNVSDALGVDASGWSWSSKFGDLNADGFLDLYSVNGMIAEELFGHLPNHELVEENQAFKNMSGSAFVAAPEWGLNATESGRGMSMADLDGDGDLDIVINNLRAPAMLFENQLCEGSHLIVNLRQSNSANTDALGARLTLFTSTGVYQREVHAASGYLSGDASQVHFGFPSESTLEALEVQWVDGTVSRVEALSPNSALSLTRP